MASKRSRPYDDPPSPESSSDEEEEDVPKTPIQSDSSSDSEEDVEATPQPLQQKTPKESSDDEEEEDPEEDDEDEIEPETEKAIVVVSEPKKAVVKPVQEKSSSQEDGSEKKGVSRVWSFNDEIVIFEGMMDFRKKFNKDTSSNNHDDFFNFVKPKLGNGRFTKNQLVDKVRRLKKKFIINLGKSSGGNDPEFSSSHESKAFQLSKRIWGDIDASNGSVKSVNGGTSAGGRSAKKAKTVAKKVEKAVVTPVVEEEVDMMNVDEAKKVDVDVKEGETEEFGLMYPHLMKAFEGETMPRVPMLCEFKGCLRNVDSSKLEEWDEKWKKVRVAEMEAFISRIALVQEHAAWFAKAMKSSME